MEERKDLLKKFENSIIDVYERIIEKLKLCPLIKECVEKVFKEEWSTYHEDIYEMYVKLKFEYNVTEKELSEIYHHCLEDFIKTVRSMAVDRYEDSRCYTD